MAKNPKSSGNLPTLPAPEVWRYMIQTGDTLVFYSRVAGAPAFNEVARVKFPNEKSAAEIYDAARKKRLRFFL